MTRIDRARAGPRAKLESDFFRSGVRLVNMNDVRERPRCGARFFDRFHIDATWRLQRPNRRERPAHSLVLGRAESLLQMRCRGGTWVDGTARHEPNYTGGQQ